MADPWPEARRAGIRIAESLDALPVEALRRVATSDPEPWLREEALGALVYSGDEATAAAGATLVAASALQGTLEERQAAVWMLADLGAEGADTALALLREGGLGEDELDAVVGTLVQAGRLRDLLAESTQRDVLRLVAGYVAGDDHDADSWSALRPHLTRMLDATDDDVGESLVDSALDAGDWALVESLALRAETSTWLRSYIVEALLDGSAAEEPEVAALQARGAALLRRLLQPEVEVTVRRATVDTLRHTWFELPDPGTRAHVETTLRRTAAGDRNAWVRLAAEAALEVLLDTDE